MTLAPGAGVWSQNIRVSSDASFDAESYPEIAVSSSGEAIAVWTRATNDRSDIYSARLPAGADTWSTPIRVSDSSGGDKGMAAVAFGPDGTAYAVWRDSDGGPFTVWFATLSAGASSWSTNTPISSDPTSDYQTNPVIGVDGAGIVVVVWNDHRNGVYQIVSRRQLAGSWGPVTVIGNDECCSPAISVRASGRAILTWGGAATRVSEYDPGLGSWTSPETLDFPSGGVDGITGVALGAERAVVLSETGPFTPSGPSDVSIMARVKDYLRPAVRSGPLI